MDFRLTQSLKIWVFLMVVTPAGISTDTRELHPEKTAVPKDVTLEGSSMCTRELHPEKTPFPIDVKPEGSPMCIRELLLQKR
jgi:hypothetical protein